MNEDIQDKLDLDIKNGFFKREVRDLVAFWIMELKEIGYQDYLDSPLAISLNDHALTGARQGERAINLNNSGGRLIYKFYKNKVIVKVIKITHDHDYT